MEELKVKIYCDGSCKNVKGSENEETGIGVFVEIEGENDGLWDLGAEGNNGTNNTAEWEALSCGLIILKSIENLSEGTPIQAEIFSDSQLVVNQFNGSFKIKNENLKQLYNQTKNQFLSLNETTKVDLKWVGRDWNKNADRLSKIGRSLTIAA